MRFHFAPFLALSLLSACAVTPNEGDVASSSESITGGVPSTSQSVVYISIWRASQNAWDVCSGTLISPTYVLTTQGGALSDLNKKCHLSATDDPTTITVQTVPHVNMQWSSVSNIVSFQSGTSTGFPLLLHLTTPINLASYPAISSAALSQGASMTCVSPNPTGAYDGPVEAQFTVSEAFHPTIGYWGMSPVNGASFVNDYGDGCFQGNTLVAVELYPEGTTYKAAMQDVSFLKPSIDALFCGTRTCGTVLEGSTTISCGTCDIDSKCQYGSCVPIVRNCGIGRVDCDGVCLPAKYCY